MKKLILLLGVLAIVTSIAIAAVMTGVRGETLSAVQVRKRWGQEPFSEEGFRNGTMEQRAAMAASLLSQRSKFLGINRGEIRRRLGDFSGYYVSGLYPTYLIHEAKQLGQESWQLVFLIDSAGAVQNIVVHKNCCYSD